MKIEQLETPVAVVDLDKLEANIQGLQRYLDEHQIACRPHIKTHKLPEVAHMQLQAGAVGINCQKLGEAEVMAQAGISDILITYNIIGAAKLERLVRLRRRINLSVTADAAPIIAGYADALKDSGVSLPVLVEFDTGANRCGAQSPAEAADLARQIEAASGLHFAGLMTYPSNQNTDSLVREIRSLLAADGIAVTHVSGGGSPRMWEAHHHTEVTEYRAGTYVYGDRSLVKKGTMTLAQCALRVITTVMSHPVPERAIFDGGGKALSYDTLDPEAGHGYVVEYPETRIYGLSEEHAHVDFSRSARKPQIGERVSIIPNHCCLVSNLFNQIVGVRGDEVEVIWPVACRGLMQ